jgi:putative sterol carrier protein
VETIPYLSAEWARAVEQALRGRTMGNITATATFHHFHTPSGKDQYLHLSYLHGAFCELLLGEGDGPAAAFYLNGDYDVYADVLCGKLDAARAISTNRLKLKGNLMQIMRLAPFMHVITDALVAVPTGF